MKKKLAILLAALLCLGMIACGGDKPSEPQTDQEPAQDTTPEGETAGEADTTEAETEPEEETVDTSVMTDYAWSLTEEGKTVALTFDGTNATLNILEGSEDKSVSGEWTATADTLTIGSTEMEWQVLASFCRITLNGTTYSLVKSDSAAQAAGPYTLLTNSWSGDGASLSFSGDTATIAVEGTDLNWTGPYTLDAADSLHLKDGSEGSENLMDYGAVTVTSTSDETEDFPAAYAADGDQTTRWASLYEDPQYLTIDLGSAKTFGAVSVYWEAAAAGDYNIQISDDGENWTTIAEVTGNTTGTAKEVEDRTPVNSILAEPVTAQYLRIEGLTRITTYGYSIWEVELYESVPGSADCTVAYNDDGSVALTINDTTYTLNK